ncbi:MAG: transposase [Bacteroidota bacterium]
MQVQLGRWIIAKLGYMLVYVLGSALSLLDERLFLPKEWIKDEQRSKAAGIPEEQMRYRSKVELALEMVMSALSKGIEFDWVGGNGLYKLLF